MSKQELSRICRSHKFDVPLLNSTLVGVGQTGLEEEGAKEDRRKGRKEAGTKEEEEERKQGGRQGREEK